MSDYGDMSEVLDRDIQTALPPPLEDSLLVSWVVIADVLHPTGERVIVQLDRPGSTVWNNKGMLYYAMTEMANNEGHADL